MQPLASSFNVFLLFPVCSAQQFDRKVVCWHVVLYAYKINGALVGDEMNDVPYRLRRHRSEIVRSQYIDVKELR
jgi:hypothetical protein